MMDKIMKYIPRILIVLTLGTIVVLFCAGIIDRCTFHCQVKKAAVDDLKTMLSDNISSINAPSCTLDSIIGDKKSETDKKNNISSNSIVVVNKVADTYNSHPNAESILYVLSQSDSLLSANGLTFCVTLIVSLLAALLLFKIDSNDKLIKQNQQIFLETRAANDNLIEQNKQSMKETEDIQKKAEIIKNEIEKIKADTKNLKDENNRLSENNKKLQEKTLILQNQYTSVYAHTGKFNQILTKTGILYNLVMFIGNLSNSLPDNNLNENLHTNIAYFCNRLSVVCGEIEDFTNSQENKLDYLAKEEKGLLHTYLEDALGELDRLLLHITNCELKSIIKNSRDKVKEIKGVIDKLDIRNDCHSFQSQST